MRALSRIQTRDPELNRVQDALLAVLNPALRRMVTTPDPVPVVTGSKGGNAALASLIAALASIGLIEDQTT